MTAGPDVSVVVPTFDRSSRLARLVSALEAQTLHPDRFEVIVVDDASTDDTPAVLAELAARSELDMRTVRTERNGGPAIARNVGWRRARAPVVAFTDDDCTPTPGWLEAGLAAITEADVVIGRTAPPRGAEVTPFSRVVAVEEVRFFEACNAFYRRRDLRAVGGFDEGFPTAGGEDTDLGLRVVGLGGVARFEPAAVVHHDVRSSTVREAVRDVRAGIGIPLLVRKHPRLRQDVLVAGVFWSRVHALTVLGVVGTLAAAATRRPGPLAAWLPWLRDRLRRRGGSLRDLPGHLAVDVADVATMLRGSIRYRTVVL